MGIHYIQSAGYTLGHTAEEAIGDSWAGEILAFFLIDLLLTPDPPLRTLVDPVSL